MQLPSQKMELRFPRHREYRNESGKKPTQPISRDEKWKRSAEARSGKCGYVGCSISLLDQTFQTKQAASTSHQRGAKPRPMLDQSAGRPQSAHRRPRLLGICADRTCGSSSGPHQRRRWRMRRESKNSSRQWAHDASGGSFPA